MTEHKFIDNIEYKQCSCCKEFKNLNLFQKRSDSKDGYRDKCIACLDIVKQAWLSRSKEEVTHKICSKCKVDKLISEFTKDSNSTDGYSYICKNCTRLYRQQNAENIIKYTKEYRNRPETKEYYKRYYEQYKINNPDKIKQSNIRNLKRYYDNRDEILAKVKEQYRLKHLSYIQAVEQRNEQKEKIKQEQLVKKQKQQELFDKGLKQCNVCNIVKPLSEFYLRKTCLDGYSGQCKQCELLKQKQYKENLTVEQKEKHKLYIKNYTIENKEKIINYQRNYKLLNSEKIKQADRQRHEQNKLSRNFSTAIYNALKDNKANRHWEDLVPYNLQQLKEHLESQFTPEMNWDNYGSYWEIDHIIPQNLFKFETENDIDFKLCWSLMNLRPLDKITNRSRPKDGRDISENLKQQILNQFNPIIQ